jgi:NADPH:quinone reductase-like Zn-dependent oxidoreductase
VRRLTAGAGADIAIEAIGNPTTMRDAFSTLRPGGRLVVIGLPGGRKAELDLGMLLAKRLSVYGTTLRARPVDDKGAIVRSTVDNVWPLVSGGAVRPVVYAEVPMERAAEAHRMLDSGEHVGKILLVR